ncbi:hypothetical protein FNU76_03780 [Chitinimonas arctica]|uniref:Uncharacterized protein n=1 Tax=Chitinimonas arctica TaxID=2594795 RepID=A0A516SBL8_9NEIS|nr:hypothetical protein [Chitinimonas arctica]QDQ25542.1 hypothetical protein FNU76_03780 [Chitinimonas arctica]
MNTKTVTYEYHHLGIPTTQKREGERYSPTFKMYTSGGEDSEFRVQYHRFDDDCPLHLILKTVPHVAFKVSNLDEAINGKNVVLGPYCPFEGFRVAAIIDENSGAPIEFVETNLSEEDIWMKPKGNSVIYPEEKQ